MYYFNSTLIVLKTLQWQAVSISRVSFFLSIPEAKQTSLPVSEKRMPYLIYNLAELMCSENLILS